MADAPKDLQKAALDLMIAAKRAQAPAPVNNGQAHVGGKDFLHMTVEALVATAHLIAAPARAEDPKVQEALKTLSQTGESHGQRHSLDDLLAMRKNLDS